MLIANQNKNVVWPLKCCGSGNEDWTGILDVKGVLYCIGFFFVAIVTDRPCKHKKIVGWSHNSFTSKNLNCSESHGVYLRDRDWFPRSQSWTVQIRCIPSGVWKNNKKWGVVDFVTVGFWCHWLCFGLRVDLREVWTKDCNSDDWNSTNCKFFRTQYRSI